MIFRLIVALAAAAVAVASPSAAEPVRGWLTTADGARRLEPVMPATGTDSGAIAIDVDPAQRFQTMVGFGAAITDGSAILIQGLPAPQRTALIKELFGRGEGRLGLDFTRLTIGASDLSPEHYSYDDRPAGQTDPALVRFSIMPNAKTVLPVIKQALRENPRLTVMASPWSPPGWMKTGGSMIGGTLKPEDYGVYAQYFVRYLQAYAAEDVPIRYVTVQNEPGFSPKDYPGMRWPAHDRARFIGEYLGPALKAAKLNTGILEWDHNWNEPEQPAAVLADPSAASYVAGIAWHCYKGDVAAQAVLHAAFPAKDTFFTECSGGGWRPGWPAGFEYTIKNLMIGATRGWARGVLLWGLALDPAAGPHKGGCDKCRGVVTIDPATGTVTRNLEYYALGHLSRFVEPGAVRIGATSADDEVPTVAFRNPNGSQVLLAYNAAAQTRSLSIEAPGRRFAFALPPGAAVTFMWR